MYNSRTANAHGNGVAFGMWQREKRISNADYCSDNEILRQSGKDFRRFAQRRDRTSLWYVRISATKQIGEKTVATRKVSFSD
jgi:hypothetical protein